MFHELVYCFKEDLSSGFFKVPFALPLRAEHRLLARNGSELKRFNGDHPVGGDQWSLIALAQRNEQFCGSVGVHGKNGHLE